MATVSHPGLGPAVDDRPGVLPEREELTVPAWCAGVMEVSLWSAILLAVLFSTAPAAAAVHWICAGLIALSALMWGLHWRYLRRSAVLLSWPLGLFVAPLLVVYLLAVVLGLSDLSLQDSASTGTSVFLCALVFVIVSGAFTDRQAARLGAFLAALGVSEVIVALYLLGPGAEQASLASAQRSPVWPLQPWPHVVGTLGTEWALGALLLCCLLGAVTYAAHSLAAHAPSRVELAFRPRTTWLGSQGVSMALIGVAAVAAMMVLLFLVESILIVPICVVSLLVFFLSLALKKRMGLLAAGGAVALCLTFALASLARPSGIKWGLSGAVLQSNVHRLFAGVDSRAREAPSAQKPVIDPVRIRDGDVAQAGRRTVWLVTALLAGLIASLMAAAARGIVRFRENQPILAGGALAGIVGLSLFALLGNCLQNLGVALAATVVCAIAAAGGDFEQELEES